MLKMLMWTLSRAEQSSAANAAAALVVVAGDDHRRVGGELARCPVKTYFGVLGVKSAISLL